MSKRETEHPNIATVEQRVDAIQAVLEERGLRAGEAVEQLSRQDVGVFQSYLEWADGDRR